MLLSSSLMDAYQPSMTTVPHTASIPPPSPSLPSLLPHVQAPGDYDLDDCSGGGPCNGTAPCRPLHPPVGTLVSLASQSPTRKCSWPPTTYFIPEFVPALLS